MWSFLFSELNVSSVDQQLSITIARNVAKTVQLYCVKCEQMVSQYTVNQLNLTALKFSFSVIFG